MRYFYTLIILIACSFFTVAKASHVNGAELSYYCINNCTIRVEFKGYMNCGSSSFIPASPTQFVPTTSNCSIPTPLGNWLTQPIVTSLTPICPLYTPTNCVNPTSPFLGLAEHYNYRDYEICSVSGCQYTLEWSTCCRNPAITSGASNQSIYVSTTVDAGQTPCNSSPVFTSSPYVFGCMGMPLTMSMAATDPDGDSLSYALAPCMTNNGVAVNYLSSYSPQQPYGSTWNLSMNAVTGELTFTPTPGNAQVGIICVQVSEWRNGQLINTITRDITFSLINCLYPFCGDNYAEGKIYEEGNGNCTPDVNEPGLPGRMIMILPDSFILPTDQDGFFRFYPDSGTYSVVPLPEPTGYRDYICPTPLNYNLTYPGVGDSITGLNFGDSIIIHCPRLEVHIGNVASRPCFTNYFYVNYNNTGTDTAFNAYVEVTLDTHYTYVNSSIPLAGGVNNVLTFNLGDIPPSTFSVFSILATLPCDTGLVGYTLCAEAHIYPDSFCIPPDPQWDSSNVWVRSMCQGDSTVGFEISNSGNAMQDPTQWRLYENGQVINSDSIQLCAACDTTLWFPADDNVYHLKVDQHPFFPGLTEPSATIERCGQPNNQLGYLNNFPFPNQDPWIDFTCNQVTNSYDPNMKYVTPTGVDPNFHYIDSTDILDYKIDFQNTGTANAIRVQLIDTLPPQVDITTFHPTVATHPYTWQIKPGRVLEITFDNIQLVPASVDSLASIGFIEFQIHQVSGNSMGTRIENFADIYFDFNPPIRTNTVFNTIGWPVIINVDPVEPFDDIVVYPNPTTGEVFVKVEGIYEQELDFEIYTLMGQKVSSGRFETGERYRADLQHLPKGVYLYRITHGQEKVKAGKLILK